MSENEIQSIIDRVSNSVSKTVDKKLEDHSKTVNANIQNTVSKKFSELADQLKNSLPIMQATTSTHDAEPSWFVKFKQTVTEQYDGLSQKIETMWVAHPPYPEVPTVSQVVTKKEQLTERVAKAKNWIVRLWKWSVDGVVKATKYAYDGIKGALSYVVNGVKRFVDNHPFLVYLAFCVGMYGLMIFNPYVWAYEIANVGIIAASAWLFVKSEDEWQLKGVSGASSDENDKSGHIHPLRGQAAAKMGASIVFSIVALGRLIALAPGLGLAVLVASLIGVGLVSAFARNGDSMSSSALATQAAARV